MGIARLGHGDNLVENATGAKALEAEIAGGLAGLRSELAAFAPADAAEAEHVAMILALLAEGAAALDRRHFVPGHVTASAFIVDPAARRVLLHHHRRLGKWLQMGGHLDPGEDPAAAALREGREESGLGDLTFFAAGVFDVDVHGIPAGKGEPPHRHYDLRYVAATRQPESAAAAPEESLELGWFDLEAAARRMDEPGSARALTKIAALFARARPIP